MSVFSEAVRDMIKECRFVFSQDGVHLHGKDSANQVIVQYRLPAVLIRSDDQGNYRCDYPSIEVGLDTKIIAKCLGNVSCGDLVSFSISPEEDPDHLTIKCQNGQTGKRCSWSVITPDVLDDPVAHNPIEACGYNGEVVMSSLLFHDMMRDLTKSDANSIRVCCDGNRLVLVANGRHIKAAFEIRRGSEQAHFSYEQNPKDKWPVCECFSMTLLQKVAKAKAVAHEICIYLKPNFCIAFAYKTEIGTLSYIITPREDEEWMENPASRVMPAISDDIQGIQPRTKVGVCKKIQQNGQSATEKLNACAAKILHSTPSSTASASAASAIVVPSQLPATTISEYKRSREMIHKKEKGEEEDHSSDASTSSDESSSSSSSSGGEDDDSGAEEPQQKRGRKAVK